MGLIDIFRKLGIIRYGKTSGVYHNAKERPIEFQEKGVFNSEKDLISEADYNGLLTKQKPGPRLLRVSTIITIILLILGLFSLVRLTLLILWVIWCVIIFSINKGKIRLLLPLRFIFYVFLIFSFMFIFLWPGSAFNNIQNEAVQLTSEECQPFVEAYDGKVLNISSDGLQGTIGIKIDTSEGGCKLKGWYNVLLSYNLPQNPYKRDAGVAYNYIVMLRKPDDQERTKYDGHGVLSPVYKNFYSLPDPFADSIARSNLYYTDEPATSTRFFSWGYELETNFSEQRYQQIFEESKLEIVDGLDYVEEEYDEGNIYSWGINHERAAVDGEIVKSYSLTIE